MDMNIRGIDEELVRKARLRVIEEGVTLRAWVVELMESALRGAAREKPAKVDDRRQPAPSPETLRPVREKPSALPPAPSPTARVSNYGQQRNSDRKGYDHDKYMSLPASERLRYLREHPRD